LAHKANTTKLLVGFESRLENVKLAEKKRLMDQYNDLIEWLMMLNRNPRYKILEDNTKPVANAFSWIDDIVQIIDSSENKLKQERLEIENNLMDQIKNFQKDLEEVKSQVSQFKDNF